jgi:hypothetical protein
VPGVAWTSMTPVRKRFSSASSASKNICEPWQPESTRLARRCRSLRVGEKARVCARLASTSRGNLYVTGADLTQIDVSACEPETWPQLEPAFNQCRKVLT